MSVKLVVILEREQNSLTLERDVHIVQLGFMIFINVQMILRVFSVQRAKRSCIENEKE